MAGRLRDAILSDTRANQPTATAVAIGTLYFVTDEDVLERSDGTSWAEVAINTDAHAGIDHTGITGVGGSTPAFSGARVYHNASQTIANNTWVTLAFNSEHFDTDAYHDAVTNNSRLTIPSDGYYEIGANVEWEFELTGMRGLAIKRDGTTFIAEVVTAPAGLPAHNISTIDSFTAGQYVEVQARQESGASRTLNRSANYSPEFWIAKLGA